MNKDNFYLKEGYISLTQYVHFNDQAFEDEWQLEVYLHALGLMKKHNLNSVMDIGCGSGYKLITYLGEYNTMGLEVEENIDFLNKKYPGRKWLESSFDMDCSTLKTDVLICSDVIEHLVNPTELLDFIKRIDFKYLVLSTPERNIMYPTDSQYYDGPPRNPAHQREWTFEEFKCYISEHLEVIDHRITNFHQATQTMICKKK